LGREPATQEGLEFWVNKIDEEPDFNMADLVIEILSVAKSADGDRKTLENKRYVTKYFLEYVPEDKQAGNQPLLDGITSDIKTVDRVIEEIDLLLQK